MYAPRTSEKQALYTDAGQASSCSCLAAQTYEIPFLHSYSGTHNLCNPVAHNMKKVNMATGNGVKLLVHDPGPWHTQLESTS
mmetsp:Transcript_4606/g.12588  ORF Transcript_4606/g.12588 Transcript_4606/m.12588 type:complete len:82 (+) Transcript_4606:230-475(+)